MATAKDVMELAISYIGTHEDPMGSNNVVFNTDYYGYQVNGSWYPWCCAFVWDIFRMAGASQLFYNGNKTAYCPTVANWGTPYKVGINNGKYGDIVLFDWDQDGVADHIGFIESRNADGSYNTVEGNTSDASHSNGGYVLRRVRYTNTICMIIRPQYSNSSSLDYYTFITRQVYVGCSGLDVTRLQCVLKARKYKNEEKKVVSYYTGKIDGQFGQKTLDAVLKWQADEGDLAVDGIFGTASWTRILGLQNINGAWVVRECKIGEMKSTSVLLMQEFLCANGYEVDLDWNFGAKTKKQLIAYQKAMKENGADIRTDGVFDATTAHYMIG